MQAMFDDIRNGQELLGYLPTPFPCRWENVSIKEKIIKTSHQLGSFPFSGVDDLFNHPNMGYMSAAAQLHHL